MRTKNLLLSAAALVAGALSAQAQSNVYSVNVVGYVNLPTVANQYALFANPLDNGTNNLTSLLPSAPNGSQVQVWTGSGYQVAQKTFGNWNTNLVIPPGSGFFLRTPSNQTNTFTGSVASAFGETNSVSLPGGVFSLVGSRIPFSGNLTASGTNSLNLGVALGNGSQIQVWNGTGYQVAQKTFGNWNTNLLISVGQGFFVRPNTATTWSQSLQ